MLRRHDWPGNVRELLHVIEAAIVVCDGPEILPEHLPAHCRAVTGGAGRVPGAALLPTLEELEARAHRARPRDGGRPPRAGGPAARNQRAQPLSEASDLRADLRLVVRPSEAVESAHNHDLAVPRIGLRELECAKDNGRMTLADRTPMQSRPLAIILLAVATATALAAQPNQGGAPAPATGAPQGRGAKPPGPNAR